jgi:N-acetylglucosamine-6-phosphate deacetylase
VNPTMCDALIANVHALEPGEGVIAEWVRIRQGKIVDLGSTGCAPQDNVQVIDGGGRLLTPGLIDIHTHGIERFGYEAGPEQMIEASRQLGKYGTTCVLPTLYRNLSRPRLGELEHLAAALPAVIDVCMPGLHLEGPFLALPRADVQAIPGDVGLLDELWAAAGGRIAAISLSPDTPNILPVIERSCELGIVPFITHTRATLKQTEAAIDAGARHATHFYDVFPLPEETEPGVRPAGAIEAFLADPRCTVDVIADGVHVHPTAIRAALAAKGFRNMILATDSNIGAGLPPGIYDSPMGIISTGAAARLHLPGSPRHGGLAGSSLSMDRGIANLLAWLDLPGNQIWAMGTCNPARLLHLVAKGTLRVGADADLVLWDQAVGHLRAERTWARGRCVYHQADSTQ